MKALTSGGETITLAEAVELRDKALDEFVGYLISLVDASVSNKEERANAKVNLSTRLGAVTSMSELVGLLEEPTDFTKGFPNGDKVAIVEVEA